MDSFLYGVGDEAQTVSSKRVLYTPTLFAKSSLLYLQEIVYLLIANFRILIAQVLFFGHCHGFISLV